MLAIEVAGGGGPDGGYALALRRLRRGLRYLVSRFSWGLADQVVSSFTNFAISIYIARELGAVPFGAFTVAYTAYSYVLNASRAIASTPLTIRYTGARVAAWRQATARSTGAAAALGIVAGCCLAGVAALLGDSVRTAFIALGVMLPGLMVQDAWRFAFFALRRGGQAFLNDMIWAAALVPAILVLRDTGAADVGLLVLAWGASATIAAGCGMVQARVVPSLPSVRRWLAEHRDLGPRYLIVGIIQPMAAQLRLSGLGLISGLAVVGYLQASNTLMGPITIMSLGISTVLGPEAVRALHRSPRRLLQLSLFANIAFAATPLLWGAVLFVTLPAGLGAWLLGAVWRPAYSLLPLTVLFLAGWQAKSGSSSGLCALGAARRSLRVTFVTSACYVVFPLLGALAAGAGGFLIAMVVAAWLAVPLYWRQLRAALRDPVPDALPGRPGRRPQRRRLPWPGRPAGRHRRRPQRRPSARTVPDS